MVAAVPNRTGRDHLTATLLRPRTTVYGLKLHASPMSISKFSSLFQNKTPLTDWLLIPFRTFIDTGTCESVRIRSEHTPPRSISEVRTRSVRWRLTTSREILHRITQKIRQAKRNYNSSQTQWRENERWISGSEETAPRLASQLWGESLEWFWSQSLHHVYLSYACGNKTLEGDGGLVWLTTSWLCFVSDAII